MSTNLALKRLRICKFPLFLVALIAIGLVVRVPLRAMTANDSRETENKKVAQRKPNAGKVKGKNAKGKSSQAKPNKQKAADATIAASVAPQANDVEPIEIDQPSVLEASAVGNSQDNVASDPTDEVPDFAAAAGEAIQKPVEATTETPPSTSDIPSTETNSTAVNVPPVETVPTEVEPTPETTELANGKNLPEETKEAAAVVESDSIVLRNPAGSGGPIQFLIGSERKLLEPGDELKLPTGKAYRLRFHRGAKFGNVDRQLTEPGEFEFVPTPQGWKIR